MTVSDRSSSHDTATNERKHQDAVTPDTHHFHPPPAEDNHARDSGVYLQDALAPHREVDYLSVAARFVSRHSLVRFGALHTPVDFCTLGAVVEAITTA